MLIQSFQHLIDLSQRASLHLRACIKSGPQYSHERRDTIKIWHVGYLGSIHYICMSPRTKARNLINSFMRSSSILNIVNEERNKLAYKCCKRGKNHDLPQISQTRKEYKLHHTSISRCSSGQGSTHHIVHAAFNLGHDSVIYVVIISSSFLGKRLCIILLCPFISEANASSCPSSRSQWQSYSSFYQSSHD